MLIHIQLQHLLREQKHKNFIYSTSVILNGSVVLAESGGRAPSLRSSLGVGGRRPSRRKLGTKSRTTGGNQGSGEEAPSAGRFLQFFNKNNIFYAYFGQNSCLKQLLINLKDLKSRLNLLNRINNVLKFCSIYKLLNSTIFNKLA